MNFIDRMFELKKMYRKSEPIEIKDKTLIRTTAKITTHKIISR